MQVSEFANEMGRQFGGAVPDLILEEHAEFVFEQYPDISDELLNATFAEAQAGVLKCLLLGDDQYFYTVREVEYGLMLKALSCDDTHPAFAEFSADLACALKRQPGNIEQLVYYMNGGK